MSEEIKILNQLQHISPAKFSADVIKLAEAKDVGYFEAVSYYCKKYDIEVESIKSLITPDLYECLVDEGEKNNIIKKSGRIKL